MRSAAAVARNRGIELDERHRDLIARGELTVAALADQLQVSRQTIFVGFRRRGWPTKPATGKDSGGVEPARGAKAALGARQAANAQEQPPAADRVLAPAPGSPAPPPEPAPALPVPTVAGPDDLLALTRESAANSALLALAAVQRLLIAPIGGQGVKAAMQGAALALDLLARAGFALDNTADSAPVMRFEEYSAEDLKAIQADAEAAHAGLERHAGDDDDEHPQQPA